MSALDGKKLLIVDDEPDLREMLEFEFEMSGASVTTAANGREAFEKVKSGNFDLVISDIRMPGGDGVELIQRMQRDSVKTPLIFISGFADIQVDEAYELGASGYFAKPFVLQDIVKKAKDLCLSEEKRWSIDLQVPAEALAFHREYPSLATELVAIGRGGLLLTQLERMPRIDSEVHFKLSFIAESLQLEGLGRVKWVKKLKGEVGTCIGVDIDSLAKDSLTPLLQYLQQQHPSAYIPKVKSYAVDS